MSDLALPLCGGAGLKVNIGCGDPIQSLFALYRCAQCDLPMHKDCLKEHFRTGTSDGLLPASATERLVVAERLIRLAYIDQERDQHIEEAEAWLGLTEAGVDDK